MASGECKPSLKAFQSPDPTVTKADFCRMEISRLMISHYCVNSPKAPCSYIPPDLGLSSPCQTVVPPLWLSPEFHTLLCWVNLWPLSSVANFPLAFCVPLSELCCWKLADPLDTIVLIPFPPRWGSTPTLGQWDVGEVMWALVGLDYRSLPCDPCSHFLHTLGGYWSPECPWKVCTGDNETPDNLGPWMTVWRRVPLPSLLPSGLYVSKKWTPIVKALIFQAVLLM